MPQSSPLSCHWCQESVMLFDGILWDIFGQELCKFHPIAYNITNKTKTTFTYSHETPEMVYNYVRNIRIAPVGRSIGSNVVLISKKAKSTSRKAAENVLPRTGSIRREIYELIRKGGGLTDYELEELLEGKHQTVSASRRSLVLDGYLMDSGRTRKNDVKNDCIIWEITIKTTLFG